MATVTIIGAGMMGSAMAYPARENGHTVRLVGTHLDREIIDTAAKTGRHIKFDRDFPEGISYHQIEDADELIKDSDVIVCGVSSFGVDWFLERIIPLIPEDVPVLSITKGLINDRGRLITYPDYWLEKSGRDLSLNAVGGPCISFDLVAHDQTSVTFCGKNIRTLEKLRDYFRTDYYHISVSEDVTGTETAVALKNGYALGIALTVGLNQKRLGIDSKLRYNSQAAIFGQSLKEMSKLLDYMGALNLESQAVGAGDLYVTVYGGRTRQIGILLGRGLNIDEAKEELKGQTLESLVIIERLADAVITNSARGILKREDFPLLMHINDILKNKAEVNIPWEKFTY